MIELGESVYWLIAAATRNVAAEWPFYLALATALAVVMVTGLPGLPGRPRGAARYRSRNVRTDMMYALLELSHLEALLVLAPVAASLHGLVGAHAPWLPVSGIAAQPPWLQLVVVLLAADFAAYWIHRFKHSNPWLWQFHKVHHSQSELSVFTRFRFPLLDRLLDMLLLFPVAVVTGSATLPLLLYLFVALRSCLEHSGLDWSYGPIGRLIVSPRFHGTHHSCAPEHLDRNFGSCLVIWDHLFGTHVPKGDAPLRYGLCHETIGQGFFYGQIAPVIGLLRLMRERIGEARQMRRAPVITP